MSKKIRAMIIDDSALMRNLISSILGSHNDIEVVGTAINGKFGIKKIDALKPDIIILDLEMPEMNGIEFLKQRSELGIKTPVIILSAHAKKGAQITLDALDLGASDFILKPAGSSESMLQTRERLIEMVLALSKSDSYTEVQVSDRITGISRYEFKIEKFPEQDIDIESHIQPIKFIPEINMISIGISTGGPNALRRILPSLPKEFPVPIAIVQHMPAGFTYEFAQNLNSICQLEVKEAEEEDIVKPGRIFIAPGNKHIRFEKKKLANIIRLDDSPQVNGHRPSCDILFDSTADVYGQNCLGCIMTGMGKDGAENIGKILKKGGITIAQDQKTSIVFGMPKMAILQNNINLVKPLDNIIETIYNIVINKKT